MAEDVSFMRWLALAGRVLVSCEEVPKVAPRCVEEVTSQLEVLRLFVRYLVKATTVQAKDDRTRERQEYGRMRSYDELGDLGGGQFMQDAEERELPLW